MTNLGESHKARRLLELSHASRSVPKNRLDPLQQAKSNVCFPDTRTTLGGHRDTQTLLFILNRCQILVGRAATAADLTSSLRDLDALATDLPPTIEAPTQLILATVLMRFLSRLAADAGMADQPTFAGRFVLLARLTSLPAEWQVEFVRLVRCCIAMSPVSLARPLDREGWPRLPLTPFLPASACATQRWVSRVLRGCDAEHDLKTIRDWAGLVGVSYRGLTEACRLVRIRPHDARDFMRMLRALIHGGGRLDYPEAALNVSDERTLRALLQRAGLNLARSGNAISLTDFLKGQQFVTPEHHALQLLPKTLGQA